MRALALAALALGSIGLAGATAAQGKADPTGTWKWEPMFKDQKREQTHKLEGTELTGAMPGRKEGTETKIEDGKFEYGEVSFTVTREFGGMKIVTKYKGKLEGNAIKRTIESGRGGQPQKRDWEAKRVKDDK
jgi:hypothetical protein